MLSNKLIQSSLSQTIVEKSNFEVEVLKIKSDHKSIFLKNRYLDEYSSQRPKIKCMTHHFGLVTGFNHKIDKKKFLLSDPTQCIGQKVKIFSYRFYD